MNEAIGDRIRQLINEFADGKNLLFAKKIGINESNIRNYLSGTQPKFDVLSSIVDKFAINSEWLLTGKGSMLKNKEQLQSLLVQPTHSEESVYYKLYKEERSKVEAQAEEIGRLKAMLEGGGEKKLDTFTEKPTTAYSKSTASSAKRENYPAGSANVPSGTK